MAAKIQDGGRKSIKTYQKHTCAYTCLKFDDYVVQRLFNLIHILDIENIQYGG